MTSPRVSVVVPLYNKAPFVERCLDSILAQSFQDFEVIIMDDGSTDGGLDIAKRYSSDPRFRVLTQANSGPGAARNNAAALSQGEYLAPLDADDAWESEYLAESVRQLDQCGSEVACISWAMMEYPGRVSSGLSWRKAGIQTGAYRVIAKTPPTLIVAFVASMLTSSTVIRKTVFDQVEGFYAKNRCLYSEDAYLWLRILFRHAVLFDERPLAMRYCDASELSINPVGVRPVEPFLTDPGDLVRDCPQQLQELLRRVLVIRACKTASVYGYFGNHQTARSLVKTFLRPGDWRSPYFFLALVGCTPLAKWLGGVAKMVNWNLRANHAH